MCMHVWIEVSCWADRGHLPVGAPAATFDDQESRALPASSHRNKKKRNTPGEQVPLNRLLTLPARVLGYKVQRESVQNTRLDCFSLVVWQCVL